jgi:hypothetical protein
MIRRNSNPYIYCVGFIGLSAHCYYCIFGKFEILDEVYVMKRPTTAKFNSNLTAARRLDPTLLSMIVTVNCYCKG